MSANEDRLTIWYDDLAGKDYPLVGKKNANLGEMKRSGIPVSPGFALTLHANDVFMNNTGLRKQFESYENKLGKVTMDNAQEASRFAVDLIENASIPQQITDQVARDYEKLCRLCGVDDVPVAVRSSGAVSMPGQMETFLNIRGLADLKDYIKKTWASAYFVEAITYRMNKGMGFLLNIGVGVPKMVNSKVSGVIFTLNPLNGDLSKISVDVSYGLGEAVVSGMVTPDNYLVDKITFAVVNSTKGSKEVACVYREDGSDIKTVQVPEADRRRFCISNEELLRLCQAAKRIDQYYGKPYDIEFALDGDLSAPDDLIILQVRPESVWSKKAATAKTTKKKDAMDAIVSQLVMGVRMS